MIQEPYRVYNRRLEWVRAGTVYQGRVLHVVAEEYRQGVSGDDRWFLCEVSNDHRNGFFYQDGAA